MITNKKVDVIIEQAFKTKITFTNQDHQQQEVFFQNPSAYPKTTALMFGDVEAMRRTALHCPGRYSKTSRSISVKISDARERLTRTIIYYRVSIESKAVIAQLEHSAVGTFGSPIVSPGLDFQNGNIHHMGIYESYAVQFTKLSLA